MTDATEVTRILETSPPGDPAAAAELLPLVYDELRVLARRRMAHERAGHTLQPTALVHEAFLRLVGDADMRWESRGHFFGAAARAMRQILVDRARERGALKRGGDRGRVDLDAEEPAFDYSTFGGPERLVRLDEALAALEQIDPRKAQIVMLRYFAGLTIEQTADALSLSPTTVKDQWHFARAWLFSRL